MATAISTHLRSPAIIQQRRRSSFVGRPVLALPRLPSSSLRMRMRHCHIVSMAASDMGSTYQGSDEENPYEVLGVSSIAGFDAMKTAYNRRRKDAERRGDEAYLEKLERAYDKIMMSQLQNRKKGVTFGSLKMLDDTSHLDELVEKRVSKDIKYADKQPIVPWGPRYFQSSVKDMRINLAISAVFAIWVLIKRNAEYKPLQFMGFVFFYRLFEKLKSLEPASAATINEYGEEEGSGWRMGKRIVRSLALVFGCIAVSSLAYTGVLNLIEFLDRAIPLFLYNNQEMLVTVISSISLYIMASYYR